MATFPMTGTRTPPARRAGHALRAAWTGSRPIERIGYLVGAVLLASGLFHAVLFAVYGGSLTGPVSWRKPATFGESFGLVLIAVVWVGSYLRLGARARILLLGLFTADCVVEVAGITLQAWRGVPSHFNMTTTANKGVSMMLAVGGGVLIATLGALAAASFRRNAARSPSMRLALRTGFVTLLIGLASGAAMIARGVVLVNTGHQELAYRLGGFLLPVHGISLHGIVVLPVLAWLLTRTRRTEAARTRAVALVAGGYGAAILIALVICLIQL
jgi:hypothetical protein